MLGYSAINPKVCWEKKEPKDNIFEDIMFMMIWKPLVGDCLHCVKEPTNKVNKNGVVMVRSNSYCKEQVVAHMR